MTAHAGSEVEVNARIVYWGISGAGKRTNLEVIHQKLRADHRGDLREVPTRLDPSVTYPIMPIELGDVGGVRTRIQVMAAPGGPEHGPTRKQLLDEVDGVVFVVDTRRERIAANLESFEELRSALADYGRPIEEVPLVIQYNNREDSDPFALEELHRKLSTSGVAAFEAVARDGTAVLQTLTTVSKRVIRSRRDAAARRAAAAPLEAPEPAPVAPAAGGGVDPADLLPGPDEAGAATVAETAALFEPTFETAREQAPPELPEPALAAPAEAPPADGFAVVRVGMASVAGPNAVRVPLVVRDESGRERPLSLTVQITPEREDG